MRLCEVPDCSRKFYGKGLCSKHYQGWRLYHHHDDVVTAYTERPCVVEGCGRQHHTAGYCHPHYKRVWRRGSTDLVDRTPQPRLRPNGYVYQVPDLLAYCAEMLVRYGDDEVQHIGMQLAAHLEAVAA